VLDSLRACAKVTDCCDPSSVGTRTCVKSLVRCVESVLATVSEQFKIVDRCLVFGEDD
jgi:hypothetical protein